MTLNIDDRQSWKLDYNLTEANVHNEIHGEHTNTRTQIHTHTQRCKDVVPRTWADFHYASCCPTCHFPPLTFYSHLSAPVLHFLLPHREITHRQCSKLPRDYACPPHCCLTLSIQTSSGKIGLMKKKLGMQNHLCSLICHRITEKTSIYSLNPCGQTAMDWLRSIMAVITVLALLLVWNWKCWGKNASGFVSLTIKTNCYLSTFSSSLHKTRRCLYVLSLCRMWLLGE